MIMEIMPVAGRKMMYTQGCPKNQNSCCHSSGVAAVRDIEEVRVPSGDPVPGKCSHAVSAGSENTVTKEIVSVL